MGSEWKDCLLGDLVELKRGYDLPKTKRSAGIFPIISSSGISDCHNEMKAVGPGVVTGRYGTIGEVFYSDCDFWPLNTTLYVKDFKGNDPKFVYYFLKTLPFNQYSDKAAVPGVNRNHLHMAAVKAPISAVVQAKIAGVLASLDNKIQLNRQINQTLETMAQALFKSWFVDFDPVIDNALAAGNAIPEALAGRAEQRRAVLAAAQDGGSTPPAGDAVPVLLPESTRALFPDAFVLDVEMGWVPEGWECVPLGSLVTVKRGGSPRPIKDFVVDEGFHWVKISDATANKSRFISNTKEYIKEEGLKKTVLLRKGELILSNSATPGLPKFLEIDACIHDGWLYFPEKEKVDDLFLYNLFLKVRAELVMQGNGSVFTNLKTDIIKDHMIALPSADLMAKYREMSSSIHNRLRALEKESGSLISLRDTLLPKLISGELRLSDDQ